MKIKVIKKLIKKKITPINQLLLNHFIIVTRTLVTLVVGGSNLIAEEFVKHSETQETMVLYRALYGECGLFVPPYEMFVEKVPEGKINPTGQLYPFQ